MSSPLHLPLRILIKGPSTVVWTSMMNGPRTDFTYPRALEQRLLDRGRAVEVRNGGVLGWQTKEMFTTWEDEIVAWSPDIVTLAVGHYEALHAILPRSLERGANTVVRRSGLLRRLYYRRFLRGLARLVIHVQRIIDGPHLKLTRRMRRVIADTEAYITATRMVGSPLILLLEINEPSAARSSRYPGWGPRIRTLNDNLRRLAAESDDNVRFVEITDLMEQFTPGTPEQLWADGAHYSPEFHRAIAEKLAGIAEEWARTQPHLAHT